MTDEQRPEFPKPKKIETPEQWAELKESLSAVGARRVANALAHGMLYYRKLPKRIEFRRCDMDKEGRVMVVLLPDADDLWDTFRRLKDTDYQGSCGDCAYCRKKQQ